MTQLMIQSSASVKVGILEDHTVIREMLASFLSDVTGFAVIFSTSDPDEAWQSCCRQAPDVVIVDLDLGGDSSGFELLERLQKMPSQPRGLVFTASGDPDNIKRALQLGAAGFLDKTASTDTFLQALRSVAAGQPFLPLERIGQISV